MLVAASPGRPVQPVGPVSPGRWDHGVAQEPQQLRNGDGISPASRSEPAGGLMHAARMEASGRFRQQRRHGSADFTQGVRSSLAAGAQANHGEPVGVDGESVVFAGFPGEAAEYFVWDFGHRAALVAEEMAVCG